MLHIENRIASETYFQELKVHYLSTYEITKKLTMQIRSLGQVYEELSIMYKGQLSE